jgi:hypothetical protein
METIITITITLLGPILGAGIAYYATMNHLREQKRIDFLGKQLKDLYGPLFNFISQAEKLIELNDKIHKACDVENPDGDNMPHQDIIGSIGIANEYINYISKNNEGIQKILSNNYSLIDPDDIEIFQEFFEHYIRMHVEIDKDGKLTTPMSIYERLGSISFLPIKFMERIKDKFNSKKNNMDHNINNRSDKIMKFLKIISQCSIFITIIFFWINSWNNYINIANSIDIETEQNISKLERIKKDEGNKNLYLIQPSNIVYIQNLNFIAQNYNQECQEKFKITIIKIDSLNTLLAIQKNGLMDKDRWDKLYKETSEIKDNLSNIQDTCKVNNMKIIYNLYK